MWRRVGEERERERERERGGRRLRHKGFLLLLLPPPLFSKRRKMSGHWKHPPPPPPLSSSSLSLSLSRVASLIYGQFATFLFVNRGNLWVVDMWGKWGKRGRGATLLSTLPPSLSSPPPSLFLFPFTDLSSFATARSAVSEWLLVPFFCAKPEKSVLFFFGTFVFCVLPSFNDGSCYEHRSFYLTDWGVYPPGSRAQTIFVTASWDRVSHFSSPGGRKEQAC